MAASAERCAHCGKQGVGFKRCSRCKQASYCGAECQNANWKRHKTTCAPPLPLQDIIPKIHAAHATGNWRGVLQWVGLMEELVAGQSEKVCLATLSAFCLAHQLGFHATGSEDHARSYVGLEERRIPLLGTLQHFRDQGEAMCAAAAILLILERDSEAENWYQRARNVGAAHGFFTVECMACRGLGTAAIDVGRHEEGLALLRNALVAAELNELDDPVFELDALRSLIQALFRTKCIDEAEPLVLRYREAAKAQSIREGGACFAGFNSLLCSARLREVPCLCPPRLGTPFHGSVIYSFPRISNFSNAAIWRLTATGSTSPERRHMHLVNRALPAGMRKASRGREGGARSSRPDARERGKRAENGSWLCSSAGGSAPAPQDSRSGGWGGGAHQGGGSRTGQSACALALRLRSVGW